MRAAEREAVHAAIIRRWNAGERSVQTIADVTGANPEVVAVVLAKAGLRERPPQRGGGRKPKRTTPHVIRTVRAKR